MDIDSATLDYAVPQPEIASVTEPFNATPLPASNSGYQRETFKDIPVKVHIRRPEKDSWVYVGRGMVTLDPIPGQSSQVVVRSTSTNKIMTTFSEESDIQAEKRGNFVVVGCVEGPKVVSWSLNALNNAETLRLLASIELACYRSRQALNDPRNHCRARRRIDRVIKDDRRKRHRRRKAQDDMIEAFAKQDLSESMEPAPQ